MTGKYEIKKTTSGQYMFNLKAGNGEIILTSEQYTTKDSARTGIASCQNNSPFDSNYAKLTASNGSPYFTLKAGNGQVIGRSEMYSSTSARDAGIDSVKRNGPTTQIVDLS